jgi:hypothetical protein
MHASTSFFNVVHTAKFHSVVAEPVKCRISSSRISLSRGHLLSFSASNHELWAKHEALLAAKHIHDAFAQRFADPHAHCLCAVIEGGIKMSKHQISLGNMMIARLCLLRSRLSLFGANFF